MVEEIIHRRESSTGGDRGDGKKIKDKRKGGVVSGTCPGSRAVFLPYLPINIPRVVRKPLCRQNKITREKDKKKRWKKGSKRWWRKKNRKIEKLEKGQKRET